MPESEPINEDEWIGVYVEVTPCESCVPCEDCEPCRELVEEDFYPSSS
jgi:hypothetical protein